MANMQKVMGIAVCGLWACTGMVYLYTNEVSKRIINSSSCQEAMKILKEYQGSKKYLGEPIKELKASLTRRSDDSNVTDIKVNVVGPKSKGILFFTVDQNSNVDNIQLQIGKDDSKRLIVEKSQKDTISS